MAKVYVKIDFSLAWELNEKVIEFLFFTDRESKYIVKEEVGFEKLSKYNLISAEAFIMGKVVASVKNTDYSNISQVIEDLKILLSGKTFLIA